MNYYESLIEASERNLPWDQLEGKNILVTGATGLIGSTISQILLQRASGHFNLYAAGRNVERARKIFRNCWHNPFFHFLQFDVTDVSSLKEEFHFIISAASSANPILYATDPVGVIRGNIYGVDNLLTYGIHHSLERFLYVSSGDVYGDCGEELISEEFSGYANPLNLRSCYISAKRAAESLCTAFVSQYDASVVIARPCHTYGPGFAEHDTRAFAQFLRNIINKENIVLKSAGDQIRSWCYVVDCAIGIIYILLLGTNGEAYNIADDNSIASIKDFATFIAEEGGVGIEYSTPTELEKSGFNLVKKSIFDVTKLKRLGWNTSGSMRDKIRATIEELENYH